MCLHHMVYKPSEEKRKKAINWGLMIITLNLIQPGLRALWLHVRQRERHVRVSRWAPWVDILCEPPPPHNPSSSTCEGIKWCHCLPFFFFCNDTLIFYEVKHTKHMPPRPLLQTMCILFESHENSTRTKPFHSRGGEKVRRKRENACCGSTCFEMVSKHL